MSRFGTRLDLVNLLALAVALGCAAWLPRTLFTDAPSRPMGATPAQPGTGPLIDESGRAVPRRHYARIASASLVADRILLELCEPDRIVAFSSLADTAHDGFRFAGKPRLDPNLSPEAIVALAPDLVIVNNLARIEALQRLRESGVQVFDLGMMTGVGSLLPDIEVIGELVGRRARARELAASFLARLGAIAADLADEPRPAAAYIGIHGGVMVGGTVGTSFHDVLTAAGFADVAAAHYRGWPRFTPEQVLELDPAVIVTQTGMGPILCRQAGIASVRACGTNGRVLELPGALIDDPGLVVVEAAERLHRMYFGASPR